MTIVSFPPEIWRKYFNYGNMTPFDIENLKECKTFEKLVENIKK